MSKSEGELTLKLLQPMIFWAQGNSGDTDEEWARLINVRELLRMTRRMTMVDSKHRVSY